MTVFLVRHGDTDWDQVSGPDFRGSANDFAPLSEQGRQEAHEAADKIRAGLGDEVSATVIVASPMTRALETAGLIGLALGVFPAVAVDLREWSPDRNGAWSTGAEVEAIYSELKAAGGEWPAGQERGWEPLSSVRGRVLRALAPYRESAALVVVTHGVVIESLTGRRLRTGEVIEWDWSTSPPVTPRATVPPEVSRKPLIPVEAVAGAVVGAVVAMTFSLIVRGLRRRRLTL